MANIRQNITFLPKNAQIYTQSERTAFREKKPACSDFQKMRRREKMCLVLVVFENLKVLQTSESLKVWIVQNVKI